jgi:hypothetical protein
MKTNSNVLLFLFGVGVCVSVAVWSSKPTSSKVLVGKDKPAANAVIAGYKHWTQVNQEPHVIASLVVVDSRVLANCAAPPISSQLSMEMQNPHRNKFVVVYVNDIGKPAMMEQKLPVFPEGSVIVKEKLTTKDSSSPELLTVMRKREPGYDPDKGDWEYMVFDGAGQTLQASGKLENCQGCHIQHRATDYVSRIYLPAKLLEKLR